ncbi:MAG: patatin-like phospholipase family protein [Hyphomicrobiaceae bacterium]|nr:patatin-like phospholipase family protein [Hyphomicrobiaceae bacterium]
MGMRTVDEHLLAKEPKRILSLDGGGVRGLITLGMLQQVEDILKVRSPDPAAFRLSDYFDLIGGTSTGGIIATLLALGHSVAEIRELYVDMCPRIFCESGIWRSLVNPWGLRQAKFDCDAFKASVDSAMERYLATRGMAGQDPTLGSHHLQTGLGIVTKRIDTGSVWALTNNPRAKFWTPNSPYWPTPPGAVPEEFFPNRDYTLRTLARATASAPYYLDAVELGISPQQMGLFLDGGASPFNNPALELLLMTTLKRFDDRDGSASYSPFGFDWEMGERNLLLYSLGTGHYRTRVQPHAYKRHFNAWKAKIALNGVIDDSMKAALIWLQAMSEPVDPMDVDGNLGNMQGLRLFRERLLTFTRVNVTLETDWLRDTLDIVLTPRRLEQTRAMENARQSNLARLLSIGRTAGPRLVRPEHFPAAFDPSYARAPAPPPTAAIAQP